MPEGDSDNVEVVRRAFEAYQKEDYDALIALADPELEMHGTIGGLTEGTVTRGIQNVRSSLTDDDDTWERVEVEAERMVEVGDKVVVLQKELRKGAASGIELEVHTAVVFEVRNGRFVRMTGYMDQDEALRSVSAEGG
jgi:ketosteroid isomerase-like protein